MRSRRTFRNAVKVSLDNLPSGICFFRKNGLPVLCNRQMHKLVFLISGRDLQMLSDLTDALTAPKTENGVRRDGDFYLLPDGTVWHFLRKDIAADGNAYIEYIASDVTELHRKREQLQEITAEHDKMVRNMKQIVDNVTAITREEEILTMKMHIHNQTGWCLQQLRQFTLHGCPPCEKDSLSEALRKTAAALQGEIGQDDAVDSLAELVRVAAGLGVAVDIRGLLPEDAQTMRLAVAAIRECITNTLRHADGKSVTAEFSQNGSVLRITNSGKPPEKEIVEGGGLANLRRQIENTGGIMTVQSLPVFSLEIKYDQGVRRNLRGAALNMHRNKVRRETNDRSIDRRG